MMSVFDYLDCCQKTNQLVAVLVTEQATRQSSEQAVAVADDGEGGSRRRGSPAGTTEVAQWQLHLGRLATCDY